MLIQYVNFLITTITIITVAFVQIVIIETTIIAILSEKKCLFADYIRKTNSYV